MDKKLKYFTYIQLISYLIVGFVPYFGAIDKIAPQFLYLSIINVVSLLFIVFLNYSKIISVDIFKNNLLFVIYLLSFLFGLPSYFNAINTTEFFVELSRSSIYLLSLFNIIFLLKYLQDQKLEAFVFIIISILSIEVFLVLREFFNVYNYLELSRKVSLRVFTGNINITAFSILLKAPFLLILISKTKKYLLPIIVFSIVFFTIFLLGSRGANFAILILLVSILIIVLLRHLNGRFFIVPFLGFLIALGLNYTILNKESKLNYVNRIQNLNNNSTQQRIDFTKYSMDMIKENPLLGIGIGNWKILSISYDKFKMSKYTVPYHSHNDFLEYTSERGILSGLLFFIVFVVSFFRGLKFFFQNKNKKDSILTLILLCSLGIYTIDSLLNFPYSRPIQHITFLFVISFLSIILDNKSERIDKKIPYKILFVLLILSSFTGVYASNRIFNSYVEQNFLGLASSGKFDAYGLNDLKEIEKDFPNISATTIPISYLIANLMLAKEEELENYDQVYNLTLESSESMNPFLGLEDVLRGNILLRKQLLDSGYNSLKKAFYKIPNQPLHYELLLDIVEVKRDSIELNKMLNYIENTNRNSYEKFYKKYLAVSFAINNKIGKKESDILADFSKRTDVGNYYKMFQNIIDLGKENIENGYLLAVQGKELFEKKEYKKAALKFEEAAEYIPNEIPYFENAANSYMKLGNNTKAIEILEKMIKNLKPTTGKAEYLLSILYSDEGDKIKGCEYLKKSREKGFKVPDIVIRSICN